MRSASAIIFAAAGSIGCACSISRLPRSSTRSSGGWRPQREPALVRRFAMREGAVATMIALLARLRVALGFVFGVLVLVLARPTSRSLLVGMSIAACGEAIRIWAAGHLHKAREVTASGPYRWFAHPLYVGSTVMGIGLAVACANWIVAVLIAVYLVSTLTAAIKSEEAFLR